MFGDSSPGDESAGEEDPGKGDSGRRHDDNGSAEAKGRQWKRSMKKNRDEMRRRDRGSRNNALQHGRSIWIMES